MACSSRRSEEIGDLAAGRLTGEAADALLDHLDSCPECSREFDLAADLVALSARRGAAIFAPRRRTLVAVLAIAAAVLLAVWLGLYLGREGDSRATRLAMLASTEPLPTASLVLRASTPEPASPDYAAAMEFYAASDFPRASARLAQVVTASPDHSLANLYLGICLLQTGAVAEALGPLERAARVGEDLLRERALWFLGNARLKLGDAAGAIEAFTQLEELGGDYLPNARDRLASIREALGE